MNILLTGGAGYIGSHVAVVLIQAGHTVTLYDNFSNSEPVVVQRIEKIVGQSVRCIEGDVLNETLIEETIKAQRIEAVVHFAGLKSVGESVSQPIDYYDVNVTGTINLIKAMQKSGICTLVFSSSATVYGNPNYLPIDEQHPKGATNPYGRTKLQVEEILSDLAHSSPDWRIACLRYFNPVGAHQSGLIGEKPRGVPNNLLPYVAQVAVRELESLSVFGDDYQTPDGTGVRDYIHVMDLAEGHCAALEYLLANAGIEAFNLGTGRGYSVLEMVRAFEKASNRSIPFEICRRRPGDVASCYSSPALAHQKLGWVAKRDLQTMCADHWKWQTNISNVNLE